MGLLGLHMGKVTRVPQKLLGSAVFLKFVRPLVFSDPACAENRVEKISPIPDAAPTPALEDDHNNKPVDRSLIRPNTPTLRKSTSRT